MSVLIQATGPDGESIEDVASPAVRLRGPGDVIGIDPAQVLRHDPEPGATDAEPAYFALVELSPRPTCRGASPRPRPVQPTGCSRGSRWSSSRSASASGWTTAGPRLPELHVDDPSAELPDLDQCWAWAHVHTDHDLADGRRRRAPGEAGRLPSRGCCARAG